MLYVIPVSTSRMRHAMHCQGSNDYGKPACAINLALAQHQHYGFTSAGPAEVCQCPPAAVRPSELQRRPHLQRAGSGRCGQDSHAEAERPAAPHPPGEAPLGAVGNKADTQDMQIDSRHVPRGTACLLSDMQPKASHVASCLLAC